MALSHHILVEFSQEGKIGKMKKITAVIAAVLVVALAYLASAWFLGKRIEDERNEYYADLAKYPYIKVVERNYKKGLFSSTETVTIGLYPSAAFDPEAGEAGRITFRSEIKHGPLPGFSSAAAGTATTELVLSDSVKAELAKIFGDKQPLQIHSKYYYGGGGEFTAESPAFSFNDAASGSVLNWGGITLSGTFNKEAGHYTLQGNAPSLDGHDNAGNKIQMSALELAVDIKRLFSDEPGFYVGSQKLSLGEFSAAMFGEEALLKKFSIHVDNPVDGDFMGVVLKTGAEVIQFGGMDYGPANFDVSLNHLHARTLSKLNRVVQEEMKKGAPESDVDALIMATLREFLKHEPEMRLDRFAFNSPQGAAQVSAQGKFVGIVETDLNDGAPAPVEKLEASAEISLPEPLLLPFISKLFPGIEEEEFGSESDGDEDEMPGQAEQRHLEELIAQGFVLREGTLLKTKAVFSKGQLTLNGKPFDPSASHDAAPADAETPEAEAVPAAPEAQPGTTK